MNILSVQIYFMNMLNEYIPIILIVGLFLKCLVEFFY